MMTSQDVGIIEGTVEEVGSDMFFVIRTSLGQPSRVKCWCSPEQRQQVLPLPGKRVAVTGTIVYHWYPCPYLITMLGITEIRVLPEDGP